MSQNISKPLRAYLQTLENFIAFAREEVEARKNGQPEPTERREQLLADFGEHRRPAFLAGVKVGWPPAKMSALLDDTRRFCIEHRRWMKEELALAPPAGVSTQSALDVTYTRLLACLVPHLRDLEDLVELGRVAEEETARPPGGTGCPVQALGSQPERAWKPVRPKRRRRASVRKLRPLTPQQAEAVHLVGEHKGNISAAAKAAGKSRQAMEKLYMKGMKKLGRSATKPQTQRLPTDHRGQETVAEEEE